MQFYVSEVGMSNVVYLHGQPAPVARFLRVSEHRRLEHLLEAERLPYDNFVIEAGSLKEQQDLVSALRQKGHELVLDTNVAELSAIARYAGQARNAPWANPDGVLTEALSGLEKTSSTETRSAAFAIRQPSNQVKKDRR